MLQSGELPKSMAELPAQAQAGKWQPCTARRRMRTVRGKSFVSRRSAWDMACLISFKDGQTEGGTARARLARFPGKRSFYFHYIIWLNRQGDLADIWKECLCLQHWTIIHFNPFFYADRQWKEDHLSRLLSSAVPTPDCWHLGDF